MQAANIARFLYAIIVVLQPTYVLTCKDTASYQTVRNRIEVLCLNLCIEVRFVSPGS